MTAAVTDLQALEIVLSLLRNKTRVIPPFLQTLSSIRIFSQRLTVRATVVTTVSRGSQAQRDSPFPAPWSLTVA